MRDKEIGRITKITGSKVLIRVAEESDIRHLSVNDFSLLQGAENGVG